MMSEAERYEETDAMAKHATSFAPIPCPAQDMRKPTNLVPAHLATCMVPRRNLVAEFSAMPAEALLEEAEELLKTLRDRPRASAIVIALMRQMKQPARVLPASDTIELPPREIEAAMGLPRVGALWLPMEASHG